MGLADGAVPVGQSEHLPAPRAVSRPTVSAEPDAVSVPPPGRAAQRLLRQSQQPAPVYVGVHEPIARWELASAVHVRIRWAIVQSIVLVPAGLRGSHPPHPPRSERRRRLWGIHVNGLEGEQGILWQLGLLFVSGIAFRRCVSTPRPGEQLYVLQQRRSE